MLAGRDAPARRACPASLRRRRARPGRTRRAVSRRPTPDGPTKAYACASGRPRSRAGAGRRPRTARRCRPRRGVRHRSWRGEPEPTAHVLDDLRGDHRPGAIRVDHDHAVGLPVADGPEALPHPLVELERRAARRGRTRRARPRRARARRRPSATSRSSTSVRSGMSAVRGQPVQLGDRLERQAPPVALIGDRRVHVAVAEDDLARGEGRPDDALDVLGPARGEEEGLRQGRDAIDLGEDPTERRRRAAFRRARPSRRRIRPAPPARPAGPRPGWTCLPPRRPRR